MPCFLYVLAAYDPDEDRAYPVYACSDLPLDPDDAADRDAILCLMAQGYGHPDDSDYAAVARAAYERLREDGGEIDRHQLDAPPPTIPPDRPCATLWGQSEARSSPE